MQIKDLTAYAEEKYHIKEQHKWTDFPGFSVLSDPDTGKWVALLMRQWDSEIGEELERCDIKCGQVINKGGQVIDNCNQEIDNHSQQVNKCGQEIVSSSLNDDSTSYLTTPFRMHGPKWTGVRFDGDTDPEVVFRLLNKAISLGRKQSFIITLDNAAAGSSSASSAAVPGCFSASSAAVPGNFSNFSASSTAVHGSSAGSSVAIPEKIQEMIGIYDYGDGSFKQKCLNFYNQGMLMKDYGDNSPWYGDLRKYFPTYHDLNLRQLRGYFTWRAKVRRGEFIKTCSTFAYIYIYEILNGIGAPSVENRLEKLEEFQNGYIDTGMGDMFMRRDIRKWMMELCVTNNLPVDLTLKFVEPGITSRDSALSILRKPETKSDSDVFDALMRFSGPRTNSSPVISADAEKGKHLFAEIWRLASSSHVHIAASASEADIGANPKATDGADLETMAAASSEAEDLFTTCFGKISCQPWHPLANAVYYSPGKTDDCTYDFDEIRKYKCRNGEWQEEKIDGLTADRNAFLSFMHAADLRLRKKLKTGHYLREKKDEAWAYACVDTALEEIRRAEIEASRPKISIDVSGLDKIREDAEITRDSLLTDDEIGDAEPAKEPAKEPVTVLDELAEATGKPDAPSAIPAETAESDIKQQMGYAGIDSTRNGNAQTDNAQTDSMQTGSIQIDNIQFEILKTLLAGNDPSNLIAENHLMPSVIADSINEVFLDDVGDIVIESDGSTLSLVEDYREDVELLIGEGR